MRLVKQIIKTRGCVMDTKEQNMNLHESLKQLRSDSEFYKEKYAEYTDKYLSFV